MECDICGRLWSSKSPFHCQTCARSAVYPLRIEQASILLDKEFMGRRVEAVVQSGSTAPRENISLSGAIIDTAECGKTYEVELMRSETADIEERVGLVAERAGRLRDEMEELRKKIAEKKAFIRQRKSDAESATFKLDERSAKELETVQSSIRRRLRRWDMSHQTLVADRRFFCSTAARIAGLKKDKKTENGRKVEFYTIGAGMPVFDLRELNGAHPHVLTSSLTQLAYLTVRVSTYLALRLPAEITLPHRDYPLPTVFSPASSYLSRNNPFPGYTPSQSSVNSPTGSKVLAGRPLPKPRPLFVYDELPKLAKKDISSFNTFIEGVTLLAWDIAWICKTQGLGGKDGFSSWTDICPVGRNLWQLLLAEMKPPRSRRGSTSQAEDRTASGVDTRTGSTPTLFGKYSHGTAHSFLGGAEAAQMMRDWKQSPARTIDKVKAHLLAEMQGAEWEVVQEKEWEGDDGLEAEEAVLVGGSRWNTSTQGGGVAAKNIGASAAARRLDHGNAESGVDTQPREKSSLAPEGQGNGWMKVRQRNNSRSTKVDES